MLFIAIHDKLRRLRVNGEATVRDEDPQMAEIVGAQLVVRVVAQVIFPNCPRPIPTMQMVEPSIYAPRPGCDAPEPAWNEFADRKEHVHPRRPTFRGGSE
jgi:uncharacterized protein